MGFQLTHRIKGRDMSEKPILFSGPMVRALLEGRKTQTRRVVKKAPSDWEPEELCATNSEGHQTIGHSGLWGDAADPTTDSAIRCPFGIPGDQLWVKETHYIDTPFVNVPKEKPEGFDMRDVYYRADGECCQQIPECQCFDVGKPKWRPSIFTNRWLSRIQLKVTDVRAERLNEISEEDALADGGWRYSNWPVHKSPVSSFCNLWDSINADKHPWESNPWVWVVEFRHQKQAQDAGNSPRE